MFVTQGVVNLVVQRRWLVTFIGESQFRPPGKRHWQPDVEASCWSNRMNGRLIRHDPSVRDTKQVANRALDARVWLVVPVSPNDARSLYLWAVFGGEPNM